MSPPPPQATRPSAPWNLRDKDQEKGLWACSPKAPTGLQKVQGSGERTNRQGEGLGKDRGVAAWTDGLREGGTGAGRRNGWMNGPTRAEGRGGGGLV